MLLRGIRSHLLGLVLATVVPFTALVGVGLWNQWQHDQARAIEGAINEARLLAAQVDDHIGELELFLSGLTRAVSASIADAAANYDLTDRLTIFGRVENMFGRHYEAPVGFLQPARGVYAGAKAKF